MEPYAPFDAWLAGFLDGEGSICITTAGRYPFVYVVITQHERSRAVLEEIQAAYGGSITLARNGGWYRSSGQEAHVLRLDIKSRSQVSALLRNLLPHLRVKREKAEQALAALAAYEGSGRAKLRWTRDELAYLERAQVDSQQQAREVAAKLGRSVTSVSRQAARLHSG